MLKLKKLEPKEGLLIDLIYSRENNFTGKALYTRPYTFLHEKALECLHKAAQLALDIDLNIIVFDAFRPQEAQWMLWNVYPDETHIRDPHKGSAHSRGVAIDIALADLKGKRLNMGSNFDEFHRRSFYGCNDVSPEAQGNRYLLRGLMNTAGWEQLEEHEWWHFQLPNVTKYPLISDTMLEHSMLYKDI